MNRLDNLLMWLLLIGLVTVGVVVSFYAVMFLLPIVLLLVGGYLVYILVKSFLLRKSFKKRGYVFEFYDDNKNGEKVVDVEFEILAEKNKK